LQRQLPTKRRFFGGNRKGMAEEQFLGAIN